MINYLLGALIGVIFMVDHIQEDQIEVYYLGDRLLNGLYEMRSSKKITVKSYA